MHEPILLAIMSSREKRVLVEEDVISAFVRLVCPNKIKQLYFTIILISLEIIRIFHFLRISRDRAYLIDILCTLQGYIGYDPTILLDIIATVLCSTPTNYMRFTFCFDYSTPTI